MTLITSENKGKMVNFGSLEDVLLVQNKRDKSKITWLIGLQIATMICVLLFAGSFYFIVNSIDSNRPSSANTSCCANTTTQNNSKLEEKIVTLYALDPLARTFSFSDGGYGQVFADWSVYNRRSEIDFNTYNRGNFTVGVEGGEVGTIIDLGSSAELQAKYKYQETVGNGQGFASIHRKNQTLLIVKGNSYNHTFQPMQESAELFREGRSSASAPVHLGHLYVLRVTDRNEAALDLIVKLLVIAYQPNEWVTIRWEVLP